MKKYFTKKIPLIEKQVIGKIPPIVAGQWVTKNLGKTNYQFNKEVWRKTIYQPFFHMFNSGGKRFRPVLTCLMHDLLGGNNKDIYQLSVIPELIHSGTLIIDDIEDESDKRRGQPCVHQKFGTAVAVNNGNFLYYFAQKIIENSDLPDKDKLLIYRIITDKLTNLHLGQAMDIWWSKNNKYTIRENEYMQMTTYKTGALLSVAMSIGAVAAGRPNDLEVINRIAENIGIAFQIRDDYLNLRPTGKWGKQTGEDITEGKISLLIIHSINNAREADRKRLIDILQQKTKNKKMIAEAINIIDKNNSFEYCLNRAKKMINKGKKDVESNFPDNKYRQILLEIMDYCVNREK